MPISTKKSNRSRRFNLRATAPEERLIRAGAQTAGVSVTDFILRSACLQAEHLALDQHQYVTTSKQWKAFMEILDRPAHVKPELARLFSQTGSSKRQSSK